MIEKFKGQHKVGMNNEIIEIYLDSIFGQLSCWITTTQMIITSSAKFESLFLFGSTKMFSFVLSASVHGRLLWTLHNFFFLFVTCSFNIFINTRLCSMGLCFIYCHTHMNLPMPLNIYWRKIKLNKIYTLHYKWWVPQQSIIWWEAGNKCLSQMEQIHLINYLLL